jgi:hypothetical protein
VSVVFRQVEVSEDGPMRRPEESYFLLRISECDLEDWDGQDMLHVWGEERCIQGFSGETWGKETTLKTQA